MENRVLFCGIRENGYHGTKPCTFWQKSILRGKSENHGTKVGLKIWFGKHKHKTSHPYHRHWISKNLRQAIKSIKGHDVFQMNGRKRVRSRYLM